MEKMPFILYGSQVIHLFKYTLKNINNMYLNKYKREKYNTQRREREKKVKFESGEIDDGHNGMKKTSFRWNFILL